MYRVQQNNKPLQNFQIKQGLYYNQVIIIGQVKSLNYGCQDFNIPIIENSAVSFKYVPKYISSHRLNICDTNLKSLQMEASSQQTNLVVDQLWEQLALDFK
ncbi:hypothetical protein SS50377_20236 [Spironucleus salmonicida]|uniref:Uncharacterized protein n=1 Tax=Spironucleus salmonicida TaxID=348837 RepID=A0A9P8S1E1_9EUKA|nr:hypothetical protein SS50377_20236 [Spironucleus salmonicida]